MLFSKINSRAFTKLSCLVKGMLYTLKTGQPCWVLVYSVLLLTLFSGNMEKLTSCTGFIMMSYIDASYRFLSAVYKLWRTYLLSNFWGTPFEFSNSVYNNFYYWSLCYKIYGYCNLWAHLRVRYVVSIRNSVVLSGFYPTDCQISPFDVRVNHFSSNRDG